MEATCEKQFTRSWGSRAEKAFFTFDLIISALRSNGESQTKPSQYCVQEKHVKQSSLVLNRNKNRSYSENRSNEKAGVAFYFNIIITQG